MPVARIAPAPADFDANRLFSDVHWHQRWEVFKGVHLPGRNDVAEMMTYCGVPADLSGKRVLDVGAWNGGFTFECERRGADEIVAYSLENPDQTGFNRLKALLGSKATYQVGSVYNLDARELGQFDVILFLGVLYHLRYPLLAADQLRAVARGTVHIETHVMENCFIPAGKTADHSEPLARISPALLDTPVWQFYRRDELNKDASNWFGPNIPAVIEGFGSAGFDVTLRHQWGWRASFVATPTRTNDLSGSYEGQSAVLQQGLGLNFDK